MPTYLSEAAPVRGAAAREMRVCNTAGAQRLMLDVAVSPEGDAERPAHESSYKFLFLLLIYVFCGRRALIICQAALPGTRHSQNVQPLTGLPVIVIAAADGVS